LCRPAKAGLRLFFGTLTPVLKHGAISHAVYGVGKIGAKQEGRFNVLFVLVMKSVYQGRSELFEGKIPPSS